MINKSTGSGGGPDLGEPFHIGVCVWVVLEGGGGAIHLIHVSGSST